MSRYIKLCQPALNIISKRKTRNNAGQLMGYLLLNYFMQVGMLWQMLFPFPVQSLPLYSLCEPAVY